MVVAVVGGWGGVVRCKQTNNPKKKKNRPRHLQKEVRTDWMLKRSTGEGHAHEEVKCCPAMDQDDQRHVGTRSSQASGCQRASGGFGPADSHWFKGKF